MNRKSAVTFAAGIAASTILLSACSQPPTTDTIEEEKPAETTAEQSILAEPAPLWLEEVEGEQALQQVQTWNQTTLDKLMSDERFSQFQSDALDIVNATDKIAYGAYRGGFVYNFWRDEVNVRGVLRRTTLESYMSDSVEWDNLLDIDKLTSDEEANWVYRGANCIKPNYTRCLVSLSNGGKDAVETREWDHEEKAFVENGFFIPEAKARVSWLSQDKLIVGTDFGENTLTESGYPFIAKVLKRGQSMDEAAEIFRGEPKDVAAGAFSIEFSDGSTEVMGYRAETFYESSYYWLPEDKEAVQIPIPRKVSISGLFKDQLLFTVNEDWEVSEQTFSQGSLVAMDMVAWKQDPQNISVDLVFKPSEKATVQSVSITKSRALVTVLDNVVGKIYAYDVVDGDWSNYQLDLPPNGTLSVSSANEDTDIVFVNQETFISPDSLMHVDVVKNEAKVAKSSPERFDASDLEVQQLFATSKDGTEVPYFVIHKKDIEFNGSNPTLQYAYGGFQVSMRPSYSGLRGKLWLEKGGVYVLANIRGGGEFGPAWHQAGLKTKRQVIYDDMAAVSEDLISRKITSSEKLAIMGGSNGGLLVGVMYIQRPDLYKAVVCQVPLLDMLRYHLLLAGASWVGEYGSPDIPEERAFLESISPVHNVKSGVEYPDIFFITSTKDDRVHPGHARKMAYVLEQNNLPFEYYENIDGGHSASANLKETAKRVALEYTFLAQTLMD